MPKKSFFLTLSKRYYDIKISNLNPNFEKIKNQIQLKGKIIKTSTEVLPEANKKVLKFFVLPHVNN